MMPLAILLAWTVDRSTPAVAPTGRGSHPPRGGPLSLGGGE
jgi:hypothetical protein